MDKEKNNSSLRKGRIFKSWGLYGQKKEKYSLKRSILTRKSILVNLDKSLNRKTEELNLKISEIKVLNSRIFSLNQKLALAEKNFENEQVFFKTKEKFLKEMTEGNFQDLLFVELETTRESKDKLEFIVNALIKQKNTLEEQLNSLDSNLTTKLNAIKDNEENLIALNGRLSQKLIDLENDVAKYIEAKSVLQKKKYFLSVQCLDLNRNVLKKNNELKKAEKIISDKNNKILELNNFLKFNKYSHKFLMYKYSIRLADLNYKLKNKKNILLDEQKIIEKLKKNISREQSIGKDLLLKNIRLKEKNSSYLFFNSLMIVIIVFWIIFRIVKSFFKGISFFRRRRRYLSERIRRYYL
jgi:hypothetical protein